MVCPKLQQYLPFTVLKPDCCEFEKDLLLLVATVLTVYGIETGKMPPMLDEVFSSCNSTYRLRYWNLSQLLMHWSLYTSPVATVLTVYGIETSPAVVISRSCLHKLQQYLPFTVLKHIGYIYNSSVLNNTVATVLTVYGIETFASTILEYELIIDALQQYLPFTVLKQDSLIWKRSLRPWLQQYLPFTVLKL